MNITDAFKRQNPRLHMKPFFKKEDRFAIIEKEFFFEMIAKDLEDDRSYRLQLLNILESAEHNINKWEELSLNLFRAFIRKVVLFDECSAQLYWCDAKVNPIGNCPLN